MSVIKEIFVFLILVYRKQSCTCPLLSIIFLHLIDNFVDYFLSSIVHISVILFRLIRIFFFENIVPPIWQFFLFVLLGRRSPRVTTIQYTLLNELKQVAHALTAFDFEKVNDEF